MLVSLRWSLVLCGFVGALGSSHGPSCCRYSMRGSRGGSALPTPEESQKYRVSLAPMKNHKATKPAFKGVPALRGFFGPSKAKS